MSIGIVDEREFEDELLRLSGKKKESHPVSHPVVEIVDAPSRGRSAGDNNVPDSLRKIIGEDAVINGRQSALNLASSFGISPSSVSAYAKGATSTTTYNEPKSGIINHINKSRARAIKRASRTLDGALSAITQEKLDYTDAKDLSVIAKNMSGIIRDLEPDKMVPSDDSAKGPQFVIFAPSFRTENQFESITVNE